MEDILDFCAEPYNPDEPEICFGEKPYQPTDYVTAPLPPEPGVPQRADYHYKRCGVCNILCAAEPAAGKRPVRITERRTRQDYAQFMKELSEVWPDAKKIRVVQDNLNTHSGGSFCETLPLTAPPAGLSGIAHRKAQYG